MLRLFLATSVLGSVLCQAEPYWCEYDPGGGLFPEEVGWSRYTHAGGDQRWFEDGALVLDGLASADIADYYRMYRPGALDPAPGEMFVAQWRLRIDEVAGAAVPRDPSVSVYSDESRAVLFGFGEDSVQSVGEPGKVAAFSPGVYHDFELRSTDMQSYDLLVDGQVGLHGSFTQVVASSRFTWGDGNQGCASLAHWQHLGFGVVPEPASGVGMIGCAALAARVLRSRWCTT